MKHTDLISRSKNWIKKIVRRRLLQQVFGLTLAVLFLVGCGGTLAGQQGEIIGVTAKTSLEEALSGEIKNLEYIGTIEVLLPDAGVVIANCNEEFLSDITEATVLNGGQFTFTLNDTEFSELGGFFAIITIKLEEHQNVLLVRNEADEWEVSNLIKYDG